MPGATRHMHMPMETDMNHAIATVTESPAAALATVATRVHEFAAAARSNATDKAYRRQWNAFSDWCAAHGVESMPAKPSTVALYLTHCADRGLKVATMSQAKTAISEAHRMAKQKPNPTKDADLAEVWKGIRRTVGVAPRRVAPAILDNIRGMCAALPTGLLGKRDRALLVVGFAGALRRSELCALDVGDVDFTDDGLVVHIRKSKTDQEGAGHTVGLPFGSDPSTCPVRALRSWLSEGCIESGRLFRSVNRYECVGASLSGRSVADIVKRAATAAGLDASTYSGHSLRAGLATTAAKAGKSDRSIMRQGRWSSRAMVDRYVRDATLLDSDNAATGIGL